jgi:serine protease inhibitor
MTLVVPREIEGLKKMAGTISTDLMSKLLTQRRSQRLVDLTMPKFKIEYQFRLRKVLEEVRTRFIQYFANIDNFKLVENLLNDIFFSAAGCH